MEGDHVTVYSNSVIGVAVMINGSACLWLTAYAWQADQAFTSDAANHWGWRHRCSNHLIEEIACVSFRNISVRST